MPALLIEVVMEHPSMMDWSSQTGFPFVFVEVNAVAVPAQDY